MLQLTVIRMVFTMHVSISDGLINRWHKTILDYKFL